MSEDGSAESSEDQEDTRPNRWKGAPSTWKKYTEEERGLAASLEQIRNADLSIHLYNAHALKLRAKEYEKNPENARVNDEHPAIPGVDRTFLPPKSWTAWPLPPQDVPREHENSRHNDRSEAFTLKREEIPWPSRELEEELVGVTLKFVRERFDGRESESEDDIPLQRASDRDILEIAEDGLPVSAQREPEELEPVMKDELPSNTYLKPVVSLDDDRSRELLRPSIRHTLSKLDAVLMALHHARKTARRYSQSDAATTDDERGGQSEGSAPPTPEKRPKGRPRKFGDLPDRSKPVAILEEEGLFRVKQTKRGRPLKTYEPLPGETEQEYLVRIARAQKKPVPIFATAENTSHSPSPVASQKPKSLAEKITSEDLKRSRQKKLGLRDWSEVLGAAALVGFPPEVIARAAQRCANLFNEGMEMRHLAEVTYSEKEADKVSRYVPEPIPVFDDDSEQNYNDSTSSSSEADARGQAILKGNTSSLRRHPIDRPKVFCMIPDCKRKSTGFRDLDSLKRHLRKNHKVSDDQMDDYILPSDEEMDGAVHVDGFLKENRRIVLGKRHPGKTTRQRESSEDAEDGDGQDIVGKSDLEPGELLDADEKDGRGSSSD